MASYTPVKLAYSSFDPESDFNDNLSPVIFLHGMSGAKEQWMDIPQTVANATGRKVYAVDARNHGDSEWTDVFNFDANHYDLIHFMDTIKVTKAILVGQSMGGVTAIQTALKRPERVEKIITEDMGVRKITKELADMIKGFSTIIVKVFQEITPEMELEEVQNLLRKTIFSNMPPELVVRDPEVMERFSVPLKRYPDGRYGPKANFDVIFNHLKDLDKLMSDPEGLYEGPAIFIYGTVSPFGVGADKDEIRKFFPKAEFVGIEKAGHAPHLERPVEFMDALLKSLS